MKIGGFQKLSLIDYPGHMACIVFTRGCNFDCFYCHNSGLLTCNETDINKKEIFAFLEKRKNVLDGVVISGGEPTIQQGLYDFITQIKKLGLKVKLDTNGYNPEVLKKLLDDNLIDYVAMDIKASNLKYSSVVNKNIDFNIIKKSIELLDNSNIAHEFRTTMFKPNIEINDIIEISKIIKQETPLYLQNFKNAETVRNKNLTSFTQQELESILCEVQKYHKKVILR